MQGKRGNLFWPVIEDAASARRTALQGAWAAGLSAVATIIIVVGQIGTRAWLAAESGRDAHPVGIEPAGDRRCGDLCPHRVRHLQDVAVRRGCRSRPLSVGTSPTVPRDTSGPKRPRHSLYPDVYQLHTRNVRLPQTHPRGGRRHGGIRAVRATVTTCGPLERPTSVRDSTRRCEGLDPSDSPHRDCLVC